MKPKLQEAPSPIESDSARLKNRYFLVTRGAAAFEWFPPNWTDSMPRDCIYFGLAFLEMEKQFHAGGLRVYVTYDWNSLPEYGESVVALLLGEEIGRVPRYIRHVRAVFKTMRMRPYLGVRKWKLDALRFGLVVKAIRDWPHHWKSIYAARHPPPDWPPRVREEMTYLDVPLGYLNLEPVPQKTMHERPFHCFFAGQVGATKKRGLAGLIPLPKNASRGSMLLAIQKIKKLRPGFRVDASMGAEEAKLKDNGRSYSQRMMDTKLCLAPRGNVVDTFRFFEGMGSGCVVVCEPLPLERYYKNAPVIQIDDWSELPNEIAELSHNDEALEEMRQKTLTWWEEKCSESASGREMARFLNDSAA